MARVCEADKPLQVVEAQNQQLMDYMKQLEKMTPGILPASKLAATSAFEDGLPQTNNDFNLLVSNNFSKCFFHFNLCVSNPLHLHRFL